VQAISNNIGAQMAVIFFICLVISSNNNCKNRP